MISVPLPGAVRKSSVPPMRCARSRILSRPNCPPESFIAVALSKPRPSACAPGAASRGRVDRRSPRFVSAPCAGVNAPVAQRKLAGAQATAPLPRTCAPRQGAGPAVSSVPAGTNPRSFQESGGFRLRRTSPAISRSGRTLPQAGRAGDATATESRKSPRPILSGKRSSPPAMPAAGRVAAFHPPPWRAGGPLRRCASSRGSNDVVWKKSGAFLAARPSNRPARW